MSDERSAGIRGGDGRGRAPGSLALSSLRPALSAPPLAESTPPLEIERCRRIVAALEATSVESLLARERPAAGDALITVIVPMHDAGRLIVLSLKSLLAQSGANFDVVCVDDASTDGSFETVVRAFGEDRRLTIVRLRRNVGPYRIKNWVAKRVARGATIAFHDADDVSHPERLRAQKRWMQDTAQHISGTCVHHFMPLEIASEALRGRVRDDGFVHTISIYPSMERTSDPAPIVDRIRSERSGAKAMLGPFTLTRTTLIADHGSTMIDRRVLMELGGFRGERFGADTDFYWRALRFHSIGNVPRVLYSRRHHPGSLTRDPATGMRSVARREIWAHRDAHHARIEQAIRDGASLQALCTAELDHEGVEVADVHAWFEVNL